MTDAAQMMRLGSLFSGAGGLDLAAEAVFSARTVWHCENDAAASKVLAYRWPGVPNLGDIMRVDWSTVEPADIICGGWPCQPFSLAGRRKGASDERALWPYVAGAVRVVRPRIVVLENVSAVLGPEFSRVADDLAALGYDLRWTCLRASDVGAPHRRERLFVIAHTDSSIRWQRKQPRGAAATDRSIQSQAWEGIRQDVGRSCERTSPYAEGVGRREGWPEPARLIGGSDAALSGAGPVNLLPTPTSCDGKGANQRGDDTCLTGTTVSLLATPSVADADGGHLNRSGSRKDELLLPGQAREIATAWGKYELAIRRWETLTRPVPAPTEPNTKGNPRLAAAFSEWMLGWPDGWVTDLPGISRNDALRIIGNGVVPQQAVAALRRLLHVSEEVA